MGLPFLDEPGVPALGGHRLRHTQVVNSVGIRLEADGGLFAAPTAALEADDRLVAAFNAHDAAAFADTFTKDAWFTDAIGHRAGNRDEIRTLHKFAFSGPLATPTLESTVRRARRLTSTIVAVELDRTSTGHRDADVEVLDRHGVLGLTISRDDPTGRWELGSGIHTDYTHAFVVDRLGDATPTPGPYSDSL